MNEIVPTRTALDDEESFEHAEPVPVLLLAHGPGQPNEDRRRVEKRLIVGRDSTCNLSVNDSRMSGEHFKISKNNDDFVVEDLKSSNGTFVDGKKLHTVAMLHSPALIRAGQNLFVFHEDGEELLHYLPTEDYGMAGRFHAPAMVAEISRSAHSARHLLVTGPSGTGKELAALALATVREQKEGRPVKLVVHNCARFSSEEEASTTLFGVAAKVFSGVEARPGLIESAEGGILFLDEVHNLPERIQRGLLRVIEDGQTARIGESKTTSATVQFVFATNDSGPYKGLAHDLFLRLRTMELESLAHRIADIPDIFMTVLKSAISKTARVDVDPAEIINPDHFEALCLDGFAEENVRGLIDIADRIATHIVTGDTPQKAAALVFSKLYADSLPARRRRGKEADDQPNHYERQKEMIIAVFKEHHGNLSATERSLKDKEFKCSRRWLRFYLDKWDERP